MRFLIFICFTSLMFSCHNKNNYTTPTLIIPRSKWQAMPARNYKTHAPVHITIHHEGTIIADTAFGAKKIHAIQRWGMGPDRNWTDIPYHFLIDRQGYIFEGRDPLTVGETNTEYDPTGHLLICCLGNLEKQSLPKAQLNALLKLVRQKRIEYNISADSIRSHRDYSNQTTCPGENLYKKMGKIRRWAMRN